MIGAFLIYLLLVYFIIGFGIGKPAGILSDAFPFNRHFAIKLKVLFFILYLWQLILFSLTALVAFRLLLMVALQLSHIQLNNTALLFKHRLAWTCASMLVLFLGRSSL